MSHQRRARRVVGVVGAAVLGLALGACTAGETIPPIPVRVEPGPGWAVIAPAPAELDGAAEEAARTSHGELSQLLGYYADTVREYSDVTSATLTEDGSGLIVVRVHAEIDTPLEQLVRRAAADAAQQGVTLAVSSTSIAGQDAWRIAQPFGTGDLEYVEVWFDRAGARWTVEVLAVRADVDRVLAAVRLG